jgi:hypothetical protein
MHANGIKSDEQNRKDGAGLFAPKVHLSFDSEQCKEIEGLSKLKILDIKKCWVNLSADRKSQIVQAIYRFFITEFSKSVDSGSGGS